MNTVTTEQRHMTWKYFYQLSEIFTTPMDVTWLILAASFSYWNFGKFNWLYAVWAFVLVFLFHLIINMQNDYEDYVHATDKTDYKRRTSTIGTNHLSLKMIRHWIYGMSAIAVTVGLILAYFTGWPTLVIGLFAAFLGLGYSAGPMPLNSTPISEFCDAIPIGFFIPLTYTYLGSLGQFSFSWLIVEQTFLICLPIMVLMYITQLGNDTCDLEEDIGNNRHTLIYFIGKKNAIRLYFTLFWLSILIIPALVLLQPSPSSNVSYSAFVPSNV